MQNFRKYDIHMENMSQEYLTIFLQRGIMKTEKPGIKGKDCFIKKGRAAPRKSP